MVLTEKTKTFYPKLHRSHIDGVSLDFAIPLENWWGLDKEFFVGKTILEAGCGGMGTQAIQLAMLNPKELMVIDLARENIQNAKKNMKAMLDGSPNVVFKQFNLGNDPLPRNKFDIIHHRGVFQHIENKNYTLKNFSKSLKPGGHLLLTAYGKGGLLAFLSNILRKPFKRISEKSAIRFFKLFIKSPDIVSGIIDHLYVPIETRYTKNELLNLFRNFGFELFKDLENQTLDIKSLNIQFHSRLFKIWSIYLNPHSERRIKFITYILFGDYGHYLIFKIK